MSVGGENVLIPNPRDIPGFVKELAKYRFTAITGVNTLFNALLNNPDFAKLDFSSLRIVLGGGMAVQEAVAKRWKAVTKVPLIEAYGLTETSPAATVNPLDLTDYNGSIGLPIPSTEIELRDDDGKAVGIGQPGEICIRGPQVMAGYWNRPDETAKVIDKDGWFATGDIGVMDERGFVRIVDRKKDMILVSGFNVYPNEIEGVVAMHRGVLECAAVGVPDDKSGEAVKLFVVKKDDALTAEALIRHCREHLTGYKVPARRRVPRPSCRRRTSARSCVASFATRRRRTRAAAKTKARLETRATDEHRRAARPAGRCCASCRCRPTSNQHGDIFGGWIMAQVDIAGGDSRFAARAGTRRDRCREFVPVQGAGAGRRRRHVLRGGRPHRAHVDHRRRRGLRVAQSQGGSDGQGHRGDAHLCRRRRGSPAPRDSAVRCVRRNNARLLQSSNPVSPAAALWPAV